MKILEREVSSIAFAANQTRTIALPRNYAYRKIMLKLVVDLSRTASAAGAPKDVCPAQLVKNIMIRANGRDVLKNYDMESLHRMCQLRHGVRPHYAMGDWGGFGVKSDIEMVVHCWIDFEMWRAIKPVDTLLDSAPLATLELIITWGSGNDVMNDAYNAGVGVVTVNSASLYVAALESVGVPAGTRFMQNKEYMIRSQVNAASASHQIQIPVSNLYREFILKTHSDGVQVDTILNNIQIKAGTEVFKNRYAGFLQMDNRLALGIEVPERDESAAAVDHYFLEHLLEGYYLLDFVVDGRLTECLDTSRLSSVDLLLDVNNPGTDDFIDVFPTEIIMPAPITP